MSKESFPKIESAELLEFAHLAREFCHVVEHRANLDPVDFLAVAHVLLPRLYAAALSLPTTDVLFQDDDDEEVGDYDPPPPDPDRGTHDEWHQLYRSLQKMIGTIDDYREVFDPYEPPTEGEVTGSISDDLADIYRDLRTGLRAWDRGNSGKALWDWRFGFESHWGEHVTGALRALHIRCSVYDDAWPNDHVHRILASLRTGT